MNSNALNVKYLKGYDPEPYDFLCFGSGKSYVREPVNNNYLI